MGKKERRRASRGALIDGLPEDAGPEIVRNAPARGAVVAWRSRMTWQTPDGRWVTVDASFAGYSAVRIGDAFDRMADQARRAKSRLRPIPWGLVAVGRYYRALYERHAAAGIRCSSIEGRTSGGGDQTEWLAAVLRDRERLKRIWRRIGDGVALEVRRIRPSERGTRRSITDRQLVDGVCLDELTLSELLRQHGWRPSGKAIRACRSALVDALDRMRDVIAMR